MRVTDDSVGVEMERDVADGSDGTEICMEEVDSDRAGDMEVDSTEVGGEIRRPNPLPREESVEAGLLEIGRGISSGPTSSEIVGTSDGGEIMLSTSSTGSGGSILVNSGSSTSMGVSTGMGVSTTIGVSTTMGVSTTTGVSTTMGVSTSTGVTTSIDFSTSTPSDSVSTTILVFCPQRHSAVPYSVEASLRQTSQVSKSVLASVAQTSAVLKVEWTSEGDLAVLNSVGVPSAEWKLSSDGMFGRETNDAVDGVFSPSDSSWYRS